MTQTKAWHSAQRCRLKRSSVHLNIIGLLAALDVQDLRASGAVF